ncbi:hypothetical protein ABZX77_42695 [Streptomyces sp. NPDC004237]|uniref:hypothetical protein n=1 Tax=Streptomyces sp. NPDC004237 TaxID=3154455 RepID=UPI0033A908D2
MPDHSAVEAALLVEDAWQGHGPGIRLLRHLGRHALTGGWATLYGLVLSGDERMDAILRHAPVPVHRSAEYGTVTAWVHVPDLATALPARRRRGFFRTMPSPVSGRGRTRRVAGHRSPFIRRGRSVRGPG